MDFSGIPRAETRISVKKKKKKKGMEIKSREIQPLWGRAQFIHCKNSGVKLTPDWIQYRSNLEWCQFNTIAVLF